VSDRTKTRTIYSTVTTTPKSAVPTEEGDAARTSQRVGLAMADPTTRRALLGVPSDVFATWHDPHAEVRGRALAADPALPRGQPLRQSSRRSSRLTPPPSPPRRTSRTRAWPRPTAWSRSSRSRSSRASTRAFPSTGASPPRLKCNSNPPSDRHRCPDGFLNSPLGAFRRATCCFANTRVLPSDVETPQRLTPLLQGTIVFV
jgi:hypothetical protein